MRLTLQSLHVVLPEVPSRPTPASWQRTLLRKLIPYPDRVAPLLRLGQAMRPLLPAFLKKQVPPRQASSERPPWSHPRKMLILEGCMQSIATPATNDAAARVLDRLGVELVSAAGAGCCGAVSHHLSAAEGLAYVRYAHRLLAS